MLELTKKKVSQFFHLFGFTEWKFVFFFQFNVVEWETHEKATLESKFQLERASSVLLLLSLLRVTETPRQPIIFLSPLTGFSSFCLLLAVSFSSFHFSFRNRAEEIEGIEGGWDKLEVYWHKNDTWQATRHSKSQLSRATQWVLCLIVVAVGVVQWQGETIDTYQCSGIMNRIGEVLFPRVGTFSGRYKSLYWLLKRAAPDDSSNLLRIMWNLMATGSGAGNDASLKRAWKQNRG